MNQIKKISRAASTLGKEAAAAKKAKYGDKLSQQARAAARARWAAERRIKPVTIHGVKLNPRDFRRYQKLKAMSTSDNKIGAISRWLHSLLKRKVMSRSACKCGRVRGVFARVNMTDPLDLLWRCEACYPQGD